MKVLAIYYPWCYLWLMDIKINETRTRGVRCNLPTQLIVHCAKKKPDASAKKLADKYLGADFRPDYGHLIGICTFTNTIKMTEELIQSQSQQELELGIWEPNRAAWQATNKKLFNVPIPATGKQAAPWKPSEELIELVNQEIYLMNLKDGDNLIADKAETSYEKFYIISWKSKGQAIDSCKPLPKHIGRLEELEKRCKHIRPLAKIFCGKILGYLDLKFWCLK